MWKTVKNAAKCAECSTMQDGEKSEYVNVNEACTRTYAITTLFKVLAIDKTIAIESAKGRSQDGGDMVSRYFFAAYFVGISGTSEGLQK